MGHSERIYHKGMGIILEEDHKGLWWAKAALKTFGPYKEKSRALDEARDFIDTRD